MQKEERLEWDNLNPIPGDKIVIKIISPFIIHKSDVGGVKVVSREPDKILSGIRKMIQEVPENMAAKIDLSSDHCPEIYKNLKGQKLIEAISSDIVGVMLCQFMLPDSNGFGNELLVSLRHTREFGMVISAGLGGTDTELYAKRFKKGQAIIAASTAMTDGETFFQLFKKTISYKKIAGLTRGQKRVVTDGQLRECFTAFIALANHFSSLNPTAPFIIEELEINPFAFSNYLMIPLDGLCRFIMPQKQLTPRPIQKIDNFLHPATIGLMGVSKKSKNVGSIILSNIIANGFDTNSIIIIHPEVDQINGVNCLPDLTRLDHKLDLLILAVKASLIAPVIAQIIEFDMAKSVLLIPGGLGETKDSRTRSLEIKNSIQKARKRSDQGPIFLGGNSLGVLSHPGKYDTMFITDDKLPKHRGSYSRKSAFISQSGAYMITRMSKLDFLDPAYAISIGNQIDLTAGDILSFLNTEEQIKIIASYMEGFKDMDGLAFAEEVRHAVLLEKEILFYKAGRTAEGKTATSGHTASLAGDYMVCESCIQQAGAMVAETFTEFEGLIRLAVTLHDKSISGNRLAGVSNAGYEAVGIADNILGEDFTLKMATFSAKTQKELTAIIKKENLSALVEVKNPMDVTPMASEIIYEAVIKTLLEDPAVDAIVAAIVPLTPIMQTLPNKISSQDSIVARIPKLAAKHTKPLVMVVDSGALYDPLANALQKEGLPVFRSADQAVWVFGKYIQGRLRMQQIQAEASTNGRQPQSH